MLDRDILIKESWDLNASAWADAVRSGRIRSRADVTDQAVSTALAAVGTTRILDIGCGEGWLCRALAAAGAEVVGFDGSAELIARAREFAEGRYFHLSYEQFVADPLLLGERFEAAVCNFSLMGNDIGPLLAAAARVLQHRGHLIVQTIHPHVSIRNSERYEDAWRTEDFRTIGDDFTARMPWYFRTIESWVQEVVKAGFVLTACREPLDLHTGRSASLILIGRRV